MSEYARLLAARMVGFRARAAAMRTFGDEFALEDDLRRELDSVRRDVRSLSGERRGAARRRLRFPETDYWRADLARVDGLLAAARAYRDELVGGLGELRIQRDQLLRDLGRVPRRRRA